MGYEIRKISTDFYNMDGGTIYSETLAVVDTWRELLKKENNSWYAGKGSGIFRNDKLIGTTTDLIEAYNSRYNGYTGRQLKPRLSDFIEAVSNRDEL
jgi:hypothetical protein